MMLLNNSITVQEPTSAVRDNDHHYRLSPPSSCKSFLTLSTMNSSISSFSSSSSSSSSTKSVRFDTMIHIREYDEAATLWANAEQLVSLDDYEARDCANSEGQAGQQQQQRCRAKQTDVSCISSSSSSSLKKKKSVRFNMVQIREYPIRFGQGSVPTCEGPPIGIGWKWTCEHSMTVDDYEQHHSLIVMKGGKQQRRQQQRRRQRRTQEELYLSIHWRNIILSDQGYTKKQIMAASVECDKLRAKREASLKPTPRQQCTILFRKAKNLFVMSSR